MGMSVWMERWECAPGQLAGFGIIRNAPGPASDEERNRLTASAPALARELLAVEWEGRNVGTGYGEGYGIPCCPRCLKDRDEGEHHPACELDSALTKAGLDTQEKRQAVRAEMGLR